MESQFNSVLKTATSVADLIFSVGPSNTQATLVLKEFRPTEHLKQLWHLLEQHREELATDKELMILNPDVNRYKILEDSGAILALAAILDMEIVGYSINVISPSLHYKDLVVCENDVLFIRPDLRGGVGGPLMAETKRLAKQRGAMIMSWHAKEHSALDTILTKTCTVQDIVYTERL